MIVLFQYHDEERTRNDVLDHQVDLSADQLEALFKAEVIKYPKKEGSGATSTIVKLGKSLFDIFDREPKLIIDVTDIGNQPKSNFSFG